MSTALKRLSDFAAQFTPSSAAPIPTQPLGGGFNHRHHIHQLSPTFFLPRAAAIEPDVSYWLQFLISTILTGKTYLGNGYLSCNSE